MDDNQQLSLYLAVLYGNSHERGVLRRLFHYLEEFLAVKEIALDEVRRQLFAGGVYVDAEIIHSSFPFPVFCKNNKLIIKKQEKEDILP